MTPRHSPLAPDLEDRLRTRLALTPVAATLGLELVSLAPHEAVLRLPHRDGLTNGNGVIHGGILASLADSAIAFALATAFDGKMGFATSDLTIHYLRRARGEVLARARIVRRGATVALGEVELVDGEGTLLAKALASFVLTTVRVAAPPTTAPPPPAPARGRGRAAASRTSGRAKKRNTRA